MRIYSFFCMSMAFSSLHAMNSEKKPKDISSLEELKTEVARYLENYEQNKPSLNDMMTRGKRIHHESITIPSNNQTATQQTQ